MDTSLEKYMGWMSKHHFFLIIISYWYSYISGLAKYMLTMNPEGGTFVSLSCCFKILVIFWSFLLHCHCISCSIQDFQILGHLEFCSLGYVHYWGSGPHAVSQGTCWPQFDGSRFVFDLILNMSLWSSSCKSLFGSR